MSLYRPKGSKVYVMDFWFKSQRVRESTGMTSIVRAREVQAKRQQQLRDAVVGIKRQDRSRSLLFATALNELIEAELRRRAINRETLSDEDEQEYFSFSSRGAESRYRTSAKHLISSFGKKLLLDIDVEDLETYQLNRKRDGVANATVNEELGLLRKLFRQHGHWARMSGRFKMLTRRDDVGRALTSDEERLLLDECAVAGTRILLPLVVLAIETGARYSTLTRLRWKQIDLVERTVRFGYDKTKYSSMRVVPLSARAFKCVLSWAEFYPNRASSDFLFPYERGSGKLRKARAAHGYIEEDCQCDPTRHVISVRSAWCSAKKRASRRCNCCTDGILIGSQDEGLTCYTCGAEYKRAPVDLASFRFHDLRHTAVSRMVDRGVPLPIIGRIVG